MDGKENELALIKVKNKWGKHQKAEDRIVIAV